MLYYAREVLQPSPQGQASQQLLLGVSALSPRFLGALLDSLPAGMLRTTVEPLLRALAALAGRLNLDDGALPLMLEPLLQAR